MNTYIIMLKDDKDLYNNINVKIIANDVQEALNKFKNCDIDKLLKNEFDDSNHDFNFLSLCDLKLMIEIK